MGYRVRLGKIPKSVREKYAGKTYDQLAEMYGEHLSGEDSYFPAAYPPEHTQLYEIGKYVDYNKHTEPFYDFDLHECEFHIMSEEGLRYIISEYHKEIYEFYRDMKPEEYAGHIRMKALRWNPDPEENFGVFPYYMDEEHTDGFIVRSWSMEYAIFNIVYIYKTFDWENDYLIYSGW